MRRVTSLLALAALLLTACGDDDGGNDNVNGNVNNDNANTNTTGVCGDGVLNVGEECDDPAGNSDTAPNGCRTDCRRAHCGDAVVDDGEICDDGNTEDGDDCRFDCGQDFTQCGNGTLDPGEACDLGTGNSDQPNAECRTTCRARGCGDGVVDDQLSEACDDGNVASHDGCSSGCTAETAVWEELVTLDAPTGRQGVAMAYDSRRHRLVLFGGGPEGAYFGETWEFDGVNWLDVTPAISPTPRKFHTLAFDDARGVVVLFGGSSNASEYRDDTWEYDGTTWVETSPPLSPAARNRHAMTYDSARGVMVLFGGLDPSYLGDTWEYNGTVWLEKPVTAAPAARRSAALAFDAARGVTVLFGGVIWDVSDWRYSADTWEYDGSQWIESTPTSSPTGLEGQAIAYLPGQERVVLFGGEAASVYFAQTWVYDGATWTEPTLDPVPTARSRHGFAFGGSRNGLVAFGGLINDYPFYPRDTWSYRPVSAWPDEQCDNGTDDDSDGLIDCADPDCFGRPCDGGHCVDRTCQ
ncbi:MAG: hypothetical protein ABI333_30000 [bacterium]